MRVNRTQATGLDALGLLQKSRQINTAVTVLLIVAATAAGLTALWHLRQLGPDYQSYAAWSRVALTGNIFELPSVIGAPSGVPFFQWSFAPGFVYAIGSLLGGSLKSGYLAVGFISGAVLWVCMWRLLSMVCGGGHTAAFWGLMVAFLGTHLGFYSHVHASESLSIGIMAATAWLLMGSPIITKRGTLAVGCLSALLFLVRPQLGVYAALALGVLAYRIGKQSDQFAVRLWSGILAFLPLVAAGLMTMIINFWMTGSPVRFPYEFGDENFKSMDFQNTHAIAILFHPWHGLLVYHPFYAAGFCALLYCCGSRRCKNTERVLWGCSAVAILVHFWIQAAWYCWWLGTGTFGMRGMAASSIFLVLAYVRALGLLRARVRNAAILIAAVMCQYSTVLLWGGSTNCLTMSHLMRVFSQLAAVSFLQCTLVLGICAGTVAFIVLKLCRQSDPWLISACVILALHVATYMAQVLPSPSIRLPAAWTATVCALWFCLTPRRGPSAWASATARFSTAILEFGAVVVFTVTLVLVALVVVNTHRHLASDVPSPRQFQMIATVQLDEIVETHNEYLSVAGFVEEKARLRAYLNNCLRKISLNR